MKLSEIRPGSTLICIADYGDCIHEGREYVVSDNLSIECDVGEHDLESSVTEEGDLPEFIEK